MDTSLTSDDADCPPQKKTRLDSKVGSGGHKRYFGRKRRISKASKSNVTSSMFNVGDSVLFKLKGGIYVGTVLSQVDPKQYTIQDVTGSIHAVVIDDLYEGLQVSSNDRLPAVGEVVFVRYSDKTGVVRLGKTICIRNDALWITFDNSGLEFSVPFNEAFLLNERAKQLGVLGMGNIGLGEMSVNENGGTREAIHLFTCMLNRLTEETIHTHSDYRDRVSQIRELYVQDIHARDSAILELKQQHLVDTVTINQLGCEWSNRWSALSQSTKSLQEKLGSTIKEGEGYCAEIQRLQSRLFLQESVFSKTVLRLEGEISDLKDNVVRLETESMLNSMVSDSRVHEAEVEAAKLESDLFEKDREIRDLKCKLGKLTGKDMLERVCQSSDGVMDVRSTATNKRSAQYVRVIKPVIPSSKASERSLSERSLVLKRVLELVSCSKTPSDEDLVATLTQFVKANPTITMEACKAASICNVATLSPGDCVDLKVLLKLPMSRFRDLRTFLVNKGVNIFASEPLMRDEIKERIPVDSLIEVGIAMLHKNGGTTETTPVAFCRVKDLRASVEDLCRRNIASTGTLGMVPFPVEFKDQVFLKLGGDKGGSSSKLVMQLVNFPKCNSAEKTEILGMFEAFDSSDNIWEMFSPLRECVGAIDGHSVSLPSPLTDSILRVFLFGDYAWLCNILGHQGAGSSFPCIFCLLPLNKLRDSRGKPHTPCIYDDVLKDWVPNEEGKFTARSSDMYKADLAGFLNDTRNPESKRSNGKYHNSVVRDMLFPVPLDQVVPPPLHIFLGLVKTAYEMLETECINIDRMKMPDRDNAEVHKLYAEWRSLTDSVVDIDDELTCAQSDFSDKNSFVKELAKNKRKNSVYRANCASPICVVPLTDEDEPEGFWVQCDFCHRHVHSKCAGLKGKDADSNVGDEYKCYLCQGVRTKDKLVDVHKESLKISKAELQRVEKKHASLHSRLDSVFVDVKKHQGPLELQLNNVLEKELLVYKQAYHSNAFIGNHCRKIIEKPHGLVAVLLRHGFPEIHDRYLELFNRMARIYRLISISRFLTEEEIRTLSIECWSYGSWFPVNFPSCSITVKFHLLTYHIPDFAFKWKTVGLMGEQGAESIHKLVNLDKRTYACVRDSELQMKLLYSNHALRITANPDNMKKSERVCKKVIESGKECPGRLKKCPAQNNERLCQSCFKHLFSR